MRHRLITAPWWVFALIQGTVYAVCWFASWPLVHDGNDGRGVADAVIPALFGCVPIAVTTGLVTEAANRRAIEVTGLDDPAELTAVSRAANRGPAPTDPRLRAAALHLAEHRLERSGDKRTLALATLGAGAVGYTAAAVFASPWWAVVAALCAVALVRRLRLPGRLERRISLLSGTRDAKILR